LLSAQINRIVKTDMEVKMKKIIILLAVMTVLLISMAACVKSRPNVAPPPMQQEVMSAQPGTHFVWIPGHWGWKSHEYVWMAGYWANPQPGRNWVSGNWAKSGKHWKWNPGHWQ
jgi:hypothetical protein